MCKLVFGVILGLVCVHAQPGRQFLLPKARQITGVVVDEGGNPVVKARIDHTGDPHSIYVTDSAGRFTLSTRAPILIVRKSGFSSGLVRTRDATKLTISLQKNKEVRRFPTCSKTEQRYGIDGWDATFQFPKISGVMASRQGRDIDYGIRDYYVNTKKGRKGIRHGSGPMWDAGIPWDQDVWSSPKYEEAAYNAGGTIVVAARGQMQNGNRWRYLGKYGESATYSDIDAVTAKILDQFLDGACLGSAVRR